MLMLVKQNIISLPLTNSCVFTAKENWPLSLHSLLLHLLLSFLASNLGIFFNHHLGNSQLLFLYNYILHLSPL